MGLINGKKTISVLLAVIMALTVIPLSTVTASAATISLNRPTDKSYTITCYEYYSSGKYHGAIDYGCPKGTPVYAAESGIITIYDGGFGDGYEGCEDNYGWGNYADISHNDGFSTRYAHMSTGRFVVKSGSHVEKGQKIGYSGNSGNSSGPHLHFGLYLNGNRVYPASYIKTSTGYHEGSEPLTKANYSVPKHSYTKATGKTTVYYSCNGAAMENKIYDTDVCTINEIYTNGWCKVTFPLSADKTETGYCKTSVFFDTGYDAFYLKTSKKTTLYTRDDKKALFKDSDKKTVSIPANTTIRVFGHTDSAVQVQFNNSGDYIIGWVDISNLTSTVKFNANGGTGTMSSLKAIYKNSKGLTLTNNSFTREGYTFNNWSLYRTSDKKWYCKDGNGWQTKGSINENDYTKSTYSNGYTNSTLSKAWFEGGTTGDTLTFYANWTANTLSVYYNVNSSNVSISSDIYKLTDNLVYLKSNSSKYAQVWTYNNTLKGGLKDPSTLGLSSIGYRFKGWNTKSDGTGTMLSPTNEGLLPTDISSKIKAGNSSATLYAIWEPNTLSVYYNANGGAITSDTYKLSNNIVYNISDSTKYAQIWTYNNAKQDGLKDPSTLGITKTGYKFAGWNTKADGSGKSYSATDSTLLPTTLNSNIKTGNTSLTLYAKWIPNTYTVKYDANGGTGAPSVQTKTYGTALKLSSVTPARSGYVFKGWASSSTATSAEYQAGGNYTKNAAVTLYAVWEQGTHVHDWNTDYTIDTAATCTQTGAKSIHCKTCGETKSVIVIPALGHSYSNTWTTDTAATCTESGQKSQHCTRCGEKGNITEIPAVGHNFGSWIVDREAGCETAGEKHRECTACHELETQTLKETGHSYENWVIDLEPGCDTSGEKHRSCINCKDIEYRSIPATGHRFSASWTVDIEPSCTTQGIKSHHCLNCDESQDETFIPATGHEFSNWILESEPSCTTDGEKIRTCYECEETEREIIPAIGHHYDNGKNTKQPRCTTAGVRTYTCDECGDSYTVTLNALGHNFGAPTYIWSPDNSTVTATRVCARDASHVETETVNTTSQVIKQPTTTATGTRKFTATFTNSAFTTQTKNVSIPKLTEPVDDDIYFPDVKEGSWYYDAVQYVAKAGFMSGYQNGYFGPGDNLKRQDFVVILANIAKVNLSSYANMTPKLKDVKKGAYYAAAVNWAVDNNIIAGYANGNFGVNDPITREQVATILYRYMDEPSVSGANSILAKFSDSGRISSFAKTPVAWAVQQGVISGMADGRVAPTEGASRAQIASIIMRMDQKGMF
ncbi:MAG: S-layer homology domain-containing protein [Clostridia bacterium]|nr:S-layer homology domain-containing protein [Clostridia bacterium]